MQNYDKAILHIYTYMYIQKYKKKCLKNKLNEVKNI